MKTLLFLLAVGSAVLAADLQKVLTEAQTAMIRGDYEAAKRGFEMAYKLDPRNPTAIGGLKQVQIALAKQPGAPQVERELSQLIVPNVQFKEATFSAALDAMKKKATELSGGKQNVNFVLQMPAEAQNTPVTLNLANVPFTEALRYLTELVGAKVEYQKFAIVIKGSGGPIATTNAAPATPSAPAPLPGQ
jgi:hypothetical protein